MYLFINIVNWILRVLYVCSLVIGIAGNWYDFLQTQSILGITWQGLSFIVFGLASIIIVGQLVWKNQQLENRLPKIKLLSYDNKRGPITTFNKQTKQIISQEESIFTRMYIANDPKLSIYGETANNVVAYIEFYDDKGNLQFDPMIGRWSDTEEVYTGIDKAIIEQITLPPNGRPRILDIGHKYLNEDEFYAYNNETPERKTTGFRDKSRALGIGKFLIKTRIRGEKTDKLFSTYLNNPGKGDVVVLCGLNGEPIPYKSDY